MLDPKYQFPIQNLVVLVKERDTLMPINEVFGVMKMLIEDKWFVLSALVGTCAPNGEVMYLLKTKL